MFRRPTTFAVVILAGLCLSLMPALAHWRTYDDLPQWLHRGSLRWVQAGASDMKGAQRLLDLGFNLLWQSYGTSDPDIITFLHDNGVHVTRYICSTSIFWNPGDPESLFVRFPPVREATALEVDGTRKLIYDNPWDREGATRRFAGCRISPHWLSHQQHRMTFMAEGGQPFPDDPVYSQMQSDRADPLDVFFFDNPFLIKCYCPYSQEAWADYCLERFGTIVSDPEVCPDKRVRNAWDFFWLDANVEYFRRLKAHARSLHPRRFVAPNWIYSYPEYYYMMEGAEPDIVLVELGGGGERPWGRSDFAYKLAMAATHGKALANIWCFPAARPRLDLHRRVYPLIWTGEIPSSYMTCAEAASCLASYLSTGPDSFNRFLKANPRLYADAESAASVAIVYSISTQLWRRRVWHMDPLDFLGPHWWTGMDYTPTAYVKHLADRLTELGVPYDVIVESDLRSQLLAPYDCVILPDVQCLEPEQARALATYVDAGGSLIISENLGTRDREGNLLPRAESIRRTGSLATSNRLVSLVPAADLRLHGYVADGDSGRIVVRPSSRRTSQATLRITETMLPTDPGPYDVKVRYVDSSLGSGSIQLTVNDRPIATWALDRQSDEFHWGVVRGIELSRGDVLVLEAKPDNGELCRIQEVRIQRPAESVKIGSGTVLFEPDRLTESPEDVLVNHLSRAGALRLRWRVTDETEDVFVNPLKPAGSHVLALHILNFTMRDHHHATILDDSDCVARKIVSLSEEERESISDPVVSVLGFTPYWTQTYVAREVIGQPFRHKTQTQAWVIVSVNGTEAGHMPLGMIEDGWTDFPFDPALLTGENLVEVRVCGDVGYRRSYFGLLLDAQADDAASQWVPAPWPEHQPEAPNDLSPYEGIQSGSYMIVIRSRGDDTTLPAYSPVHTPVSDIAITVDRDLGRAPVAVFISPDADEAVAAPVLRTEHGLTISVPTVDVYGILLVSESEEELRRLL